MRQIVSDGAAAVVAAAAVDSGSVSLDSSCYFEIAEMRPRWWRKETSLWARSSAREEWSKEGRHCRWSGGCVGSGG